MVIEWLRFRVPVAQQGAFLSADAATWTAVLAAQPGFAGKQTWIAAAAPDVVNLIIRWDDRAVWQAVPADILSEAEAAFQVAFGGAAEFIDCTDLDVVD